MGEHCIPRSRTSLREPHMPKDRFERGKIIFPAVCIRCEKPAPLRMIRLTLPYRAWWRSNPVIKAPICTGCAISLETQGWTSLLLALGALFATSIYLSKWAMLLLISSQQVFFHSVSDWVFSDWFPQTLAGTVVVLVSTLLGSLRDRFLRRNHLKLKVTDYGNDWIELSSTDDLYFGELARQSQFYSQ